MKFILIIIVFLILKPNLAMAETKNTYCVFANSDSVYMTTKSCRSNDKTITKKNTIN